MVGMSFNACKGDSESAVWKDMGARRERRRTIRKAPESLGRGEWLAQLCSEDGEQLRPQVFWKKSQHDLSVAGKEKKVQNDVRGPVDAEATFRGWEDWIRSMSSQRNHEERVFF